jgi:serine/threonine protein kinase/tetratricopeptide (TPR) repeat protein
MALAPGTRLGPYEIVELRGKGGMGEVYRAHDSRLGRDVAVKVLPRELSEEPAFKERFEREARTISQLQHPHVCALYDIGSADGMDYLVMEYLRGETLEDRLSRQPLTTQEALRIGLEIAEAVEAAHLKGVVHRDLKPGNVMLAESGTKVLDFGLARTETPAEATESLAGTRAMPETLTEKGQILGTVPYMSPEHLHGRAIAPCSDVFSLGIMLYEMVSGSRPFGGDTQAALISSILRDTPPPPSGLVDLAPAGLDGVVTRCLEKDPLERYESAAELRSALAALIDGLSSGVSRSAPPAVAPVAKSYRTPLVGREAESTVLREALTRAMQGSGSLVTLAGEPGVGKTRLSSELMHVARAEGVIALAGHCYEGEGARPFSPWVEILDATTRIAPKHALREALGDGAPEIAKLQPALRRLYPDLPPPLDLPPEAERAYLFDCFCDFVDRSSRVQPLLFVLEDLHWADEPTVLLLRHVCLRLSELPILVVGTYRDVELDVARPLAAALRHLVRERLVERVSLHRLTADNVAEILEAMSGREPPAALVEAVHGETEGNPFFVEEVYEHLAEEGRLFDDAGEWRDDLSLEELDVPEGVRLVLGRRLERLDDEGRGVLTAAAVLGRRFSYPLLEAVVGSDAGDVLDEIDAAERLHLLEAEASSASREPRYRFAHELIRQTLLQGLSMPRRQRLHLKVADAFESTYGSRIEEHAPALAHHLYQSGAAADEAKTIHFLGLAGDQAQEAGAFEEAFGHFEAALELIEPADLAGRAGLLTKRARAAHSMGRTERTFADLEAACELYGKVGDLEAVGSVATDLAVQGLWRADFERALPVIEPALAAASEVAGPTRCQLKAAAGAMLVAKGDCPTGYDLLNEAVREAEQLGDERLLGELFVQRASCHWGMMTTTPWIEEGERGLALLEKLNDPWNGVYLATTTRIGLAFAGRPKDALSGLAEYQELADKLGHTMARASGGVARGFSEFQLTGDIDGLRSFAEWYRDYNRAIDYPWEFVGWGHLGLCDFWRGHWERATESFEESLRIETERPSCCFAWGNYFMVLCYAGDPRANELLEAKEGSFPVAGQAVNTNGSWISVIRGIEGFAVQGRRDRAAELYPLALAAIETGAVIEFFSTSMPQFAAALSAACGEQWAEAEEHYRVGLEQAERVPHVIMQPELRRWYAQMLIDRGATGDRDKARALLAEAAEGYERLGMPRHLEMARELAKSAL